MHGAALGLLELRTHILLPIEPETSRAPLALPHAPLDSMRGAMKTARRVAIAR